MRLHPTPLATLLVSLSLTLPMSAAHALDDARFQEATALLLKAQSTGEAAATQAAADRWTALAAAEPGNPVARAYAGSAVSLQATTTMLPWRKMGFAEDGLALIDKALAQLGPEHDTQRVAGTPMALLVRFTAASTFLALPGMFNRGARGEEQLRLTLEHAGFAGAPLGFKAAVWLRAGQHAAKQQRKDEARKLFERVVASQAPQAAAAQQQLKDL